MAEVTHPRLTIPPLKWHFSTHGAPGAGGRYAKKLSRIRGQVTSFLRTYLGDMTVSKYLG
jgi:hypothetical protein